MVDNEYYRPPGLAINKSKKPKIRISKIKYVNWNIEKQYRAGVIFTGINPITKEFNYCYGIDRKHNEYTDFGGHREKYDKNILESALRECREETLNLININQIHVNESIVFITKNMVFIYHYLPWDTLISIRDKFETLVGLHKKSENSGIQLLNSQQILKLLKGNKVNGRLMYKKIINELDGGFELLDLMLKSNTL